MYGGGCFGNPHSTGVYIYIYIYVPIRLAMHRLRSERDRPGLSARNTGEQTAGSNVQHTSGSIRCIRGTTARESS